MKYKRIKFKKTICALTANAMQQDIEDCLAAGMDAHVGKPIDKTRLVAILNDFLTRRA
ncbi:hypothetical protein [Alteromonas portus]|uniref:hypothetical protein n=1 Tax=Alteromonas portus TaxID=2565549 RepID=UPI003BF821BE